MCDYSETLSARDFCTRKAKLGDELELIALASGVKGFVKWNEGTEGVRFGHPWKARGVATCLKPGTEIVFERRFLFEGSRTFVECDNGERMEVTDMAPTREARTAMLPGGTGRPVDGVEFPDGRGIALNCLPLYTRIRVLQLPAPRRRKAKAPPAVAAPLSLEQRAKQARQDYEEFIEAHRG